MSTVANSARWMRERTVTFTAQDRMGAQSP
jgi:hypothetical protein